MQEVYEATLKKQVTLRQLGCEVKVMWECAWDHEVKTNPELCQFVDTLEIVNPLQPRNAFVGGSTDAIKLHHAAERRIGKKIKYIDVTSLYPWANKKGEYPIVHPKVISTPMIRIFAITLEWSKETFYLCTNCTIPLSPTDTRANSPSLSTKHAWKRRWQNPY